MVLVTGATGILGRVLVLELLKRGRKVRATKRPNSNMNEVKDSLRFYTDQHETYFEKIEWVNVDFDHLESLQKAIEGVEEVYHCAAKVSFHPDNKKELYKTNVEGTKHLLYACENSSVRKFCHVSSIAVLDGFNEEGMMDESSDFNPKVEHSDYAISKHISEMEVWRAAAEGLDAVIVNPGLIIGSGNWDSSSGTLFKDLGTSSYTFSGGTSYVDVRDVAEICIQLLEKQIFAQRFIAISENMTYRDLANIIKSKLGKKQVKLAPDFVLKVGLLVNNAFGWLFPKLRMANKVNVKAVTDFNLISNKKVLEMLSYKFIPVRESVAFHLDNYVKDRYKN